LAAKKRLQYSVARDITQYTFSSDSCYLRPVTGGRLAAVVVEDHGLRRGATTTCSAAEWGGPDAAPGRRLARLGMPDTRRGRDPPTRAASWPRLTAHAPPPARPKVRGHRLLLLAPAPGPRPLRRGRQPARSRSDPVRRVERLVVPGLRVRVARGQSDAGARDEAARVAAVVVVKRLVAGARVNDPS
jgi:hypothetical protein